MTMCLTGTIVQLYYRNTHNVLAPPVTCRTVTQKYNNSYTVICYTAIQQSTFKYPLLYSCVTDATEIMAMTNEKGEVNGA